MPTAAELNAHAIGHKEWTVVVIAVLDREANPTLSTVAKARGPFAIHRSLNKLDDGFKMTHIASGAAFPAHATEAHLIDLADKIEPMWNWDFTDPKAVKGCPKDVVAFVYAVPEFDDQWAA